MVCVLSSAGDQLPVMPFFEMIGSGDKPSPEQMAETASKVGVTDGFTVMVNAAVVAHCPADGVKVYIFVCVLSKAGDQLPVMPFFEVIGSGFNPSPAQIAETASKVGVTNVFTMMFIVVLEAHCPATGVKV